MSDAHDRLAGLDPDRLQQLADPTPTTCGVHGTPTLVVTDGVVERKVLRCWRCDLRAAVRFADHAATTLEADAEHGAGCECSVCWELVHAFDRLRRAYAEASR